MLPSRFSAAKLFYDLRLDLKIEHLPIFRGYGSGRRGEDYQRDAPRPLGLAAGRTPVATASRLAFGSGDTAAGC